MIYPSGAKLDNFWNDIDIKFWIHKNTKILVWGQILTIIFTFSFRKWVFNRSLYFLIEFHIQFKFQKKTKQAGAEQCQAQEKLWRAYLWWSSRVDGWGLSLQIGATTDPQTPQPPSKPLPNV